MPEPKRIEPPKASLRRVIGTPASRPSSHSIAGTSAKLATIVEKMKQIRSRDENAA